MFPCPLPFEVYITSQDLIESRHHNTSPMALALSRKFPKNKIKMTTEGATIDGRWELVFGESALRYLHYHKQGYGMPPTTFFFHTGDIHGLKRN